MWDTDERTWFDNPPRKKRGHSKKRKGAKHMARKKRKKLYGAAAQAHAAKRAGRKYHPKKKRSYHAKKRSSSKRRRSHRRTSARRASSAGRVLRYRRPNPPGIRGLAGQLIDGAKDAAAIVVGEAGTNIIAGYIPFGGTVALDLAKKLVSALALSYVSGFVLPKSVSRMLLVGGLVGIIRKGAKDLNVPIIAPALADYDSPLAVGAYPQAAISAYPGVSAYPAVLSGEDDDLMYT